MQPKTIEFPIALITLQTSLRLLDKAITQVPAASNLRDEIERLYGELGALVIRVKENSFDAVGMDKVGNW